MEWRGSSTHNYRVGVSPNRRRKGPMIFFADLRHVKETRIAVEIMLDVPKPSS